MGIPGWRSEFKMKPDIIHRLSIQNKALGRA
jgi:hypothetical protein